MKRLLALLHPRRILATVVALSTQRAAGESLALNDLEYLDMPGLNVMLAHDFYPEGHQGGISIIQNGRRVAANGDLRLDRTPGQWSPVPAHVGERIVDSEAESIRCRFQYPDESRNRKGFNPIAYPELEFTYDISVRPDGGSSFLIAVDLSEPLPAAWDDRVSFMLELFPGILFGKSYAMDRAQFGVFPRQANGPGHIDADGAYVIDALASGKKLVVAPEDDGQRMTIESVVGGDLELVDGRGQHDNGWFIVRSTLAKGATTNALQWRVTPHAIPGWTSPPVVQVSQVGYHPKQPKHALIELDRREAGRKPVVLSRIGEDGLLMSVLEETPADWGPFLRYDYLTLDFTDVREPGLYVVSYGGVRSNPFQIGESVYSRHVWQPTLEYFLPVQMCHMRVNDRYRVWHGACHLDDARMAPVNHNHIDGYRQGPETMTDYAPGQPVPGLDRGGWHDAGDDDLRVESQAGTILGLALAYEAFGIDYDNTTIDQETRTVEIHRPDGKPDILQQIEHGVLTVAGGYRALGRLYRGIISPTLRQYTMLGDTANMTDNRVFDPDTAGDDTPAIGQGVPGSPDDRWVFTEENARRELVGASGLAAAARVLRGYNDGMARECLEIAQQLWKDIEADPPSMKVGLAVELLLATGDAEYAEFLVGHAGDIAERFERDGWVAARALPHVEDPAFHAAIRAAAETYSLTVSQREKKTPYGVPYEPRIWGAGWGIQRFGAQQYFLHEAFPDLFSADILFSALNFVLGCHPGSNSESFVSGVGSDSLTVGYGLNRADWSYIPGGSASGTALIRPDFPELLDWPYLWQQTEYVLGGGTTDYLFLALAADHLLNRR